MKFKVGDIIKANSDNYTLTRKREKWVGKVTNIRAGSFEAKTINSRDEEQIGKSFWGLDYEDFDLMVPNTQIYITTDGKTTTSVLKENGKIVKRGIARCNPEDEFDFKTGAKLAFDRLIGVEAKEETKDDTHKFKVGDRVKTYRGTGEVLLIDENQYGVGIKGFKGHSLGLNRKGYKKALEKGYLNQCWWFLEDDLKLVEETEELTDKGFQKGKVYVFRKSRYLKVLDLKETTVEWVNQCDGRIVEVIDNRIAQLGSRNIQPAYCEEIGNV